MLQSKNSTCMLHTCTRSGRASSLHLTGNLWVQGSHFQYKKAASSRAEILASVSTPSIWADKDDRVHITITQRGDASPFFLNTLSFSPCSLWKGLSCKHFCVGNYQRRLRISFWLIRHPPMCTLHTAAPSTYTGTLAQWKRFYGLLQNIRKLYE